MKQQLKKLEQRIDALSLRERAIVFAAVVFALLFLVNHFLLDPQFNRQKQFAEQIRQHQLRASEMHAAIQQKIKANELDPDAPEKARLEALKQQFRQTQGGLEELQKSLVPPEKMSSMLEDILQRNGKLKLLALKTLPVAAINDNAAKNATGKEVTAATANAAAVASADAVPAEGFIYKHAVEITVQGSYPDMINYVAELERLPWRLFWGKAKLNAEDYTKASLTLTVFTLSLDRKWLNL